MKFGIPLSRVNPAHFDEVAVAADECGVESLWLAEHLVLPLRIEGQLVPGEEHPPLSPRLPVYDAPAYLAYLAARTRRIRLGTFVYLLGLRHPFVGARAFATLDRVSGGRALCGVGAGWLRTEWEAAGLDPRTRGRRLDETIAVCRRLWSEPVVEHHGELIDFEPVAFEPKPVQEPLPVLVGGESDAALRRAARLGDGWLGMDHSAESAADRVGRLRRFAADAGRDPDAVEVTVIGAVEGETDVERYAAAGVDRLIVVPWRRSREAVDGLVAFAERIGLTGR
ncbi:MAG: TIGR03619 family F420-dependent LLM class oxidoreductase [Acidimicrobiia bacterium]